MLIVYGIIIVIEGTAGTIAMESPKLVVGKVISLEAVGLFGAVWYLDALLPAGHFFIYKGADAAIQFPLRPGCTFRHSEAIFSQQQIQHHYGRCNSFAALGSRAFVSFDFG